MDFDALKSVAEGMNEKNDCAVRAVTIVSGIPYRKIHRIFIQCGRRRRGRTKKHITHAVLARLGIGTVSILFKGKTIRTLARELSKGCYLVSIRGHILTIKGGKVCDWTEGRLHRVLNVEAVYEEHIGEFIDDSKETTLRLLQNLHDSPMIRVSL